MKEHNIPRLDLTTINPEARENIETIGHDLAVFDDFGGVPVFEYPSLAAGNPAVPARFSATQGRSVPAPESGRSRPDTGVPLVPPAENEAEKPPLPA